MDYDVELCEQVLLIQRDRESICESSVVRICDEVKLRLEGVSSQSKSDAREVFVWRWWARRVLYGDPRVNMVFTDSELRSELEKRFI